MANEDSTVVLVDDALQREPSENANPPIPPPIDIERLPEPTFEACQDANEATAMGQTVHPKCLPTLFMLCLRTIGKQLKYFCNTQLYPPTAPPLAKVFEQALSVYDLAPLTLLDEQRGFERIRVAKAVKLKAMRAKVKAPCEQHRLEFVPAFALSPSLHHALLRPLKSLLGMLPPPKLQLRAPYNSSGRTKCLGRRENQWVSVDENRPPENVTAVTDDVPLTIENSAAVTETIALARATVTNTGCGFLAERLVSCPTLVVLSLQNCQITCAGAMMLANALQVSPTLRRLDLSNTESTAFRGHAFDNDIRESGAAALGLALETNHSLVYLSLSYNHVGQRGTVALANMLYKNKTLCQLDLIQIFAGGVAEDLIEAYRWSTTLEVLNLQWCGLRPGLGAQLAAIHATKTTRESSQCTRNAADSCHGSSKTLISVGS